ncbi:hypothetical protein FGM00_05775 [Aggregatimonas sangjinii]|uniref:ASPIC/UnbV domain-containing protein n=1 Tax=Aggregatimonas sangjinii TaxID=2583587 RepID=A0A5B7SNB4_9FLAO|nr:VCBS repeat-containing protein [Aggregatimonas sangjinii]QCW99631.1 hypothetical protein FGM00_05775 [Aggregatimonas sangjinii]
MKKVFFLIVFAIFSCTNKDLNQGKKLFSNIDAKDSGIWFNNQIVEDDSINIIDNEFVYNGAGIALGDLNGDGLDDIFFSGNQVDNKLYLNNGQLKFKDITAAAKISKTDSLQWSSGVTILDINADGKMDIYVCNTFREQERLRKNLLYINQGNTDAGIPTFIEMAADYGIDDDTYSSHAQFFDYDKDGDLDLWIGVNCIEGIDPNEFNPLVDDGTSVSRDRLYENNTNTDDPHPVFQEVSDKAGINFHGYSHSTLINDFNEDGWLDVYVANDFLSNDLIYINNQDGTFTNRAGEIFKHFSFSAMGSDIADVDNDGQFDIYTTEMQPYYNQRKKLFQGPSNYQKEIFTEKFNYQRQYTRNTLQLNRGVNPKTGLQLFSETGMFSGIQETDWSWAPLFGDYDNDGWQDLLITNGFPKDVTDRDFGDFKVTMSRFVNKEQLIAAIPEIKVPNFIFKNNGGLNFEDATKNWGLDFGTYSNGAAYGDLDNDGDLDLVVNNINDPALLLENKSEILNTENHYLRIKLRGEQPNSAAIGALVVVHTADGPQQKSVLSGRGYLSQPELTLHFGLGDVSVVDSIHVRWPNGRIQKMQNIGVDKILKISYKLESTNLPTFERPSINPLFAEISDSLNLKHFADEKDFIDFNFQRTLPHKFSQYGPSLAVGDINNDGLDDMFVSGSSGFSEKWFLQKPDGSFIQRPVSYKSKMTSEDTATLLFDADGDEDLDLYIARGGGQFPIADGRYQDVLYKNDGKGNFSETENALPVMKSNSSVIKAADYDRDGDLDLFVGSRVLPFSYPLADRSYILRNDSEKGSPLFTEVTMEVTQNLLSPGLLCDALWTDFNNDSWPDLILAGELMPLRFFKNVNGKLTEITAKTGLEKNSGWWNSLFSIDVDNDGDMDYVAGNVGRNINFKGDTDQPIRVYGKDLDQNGTIDPMMSYYLRDSIGVKKEYLYHPWQDVTAQYVGIRKRFNSFGEFGSATLPEMFPDGLLDGAAVFELNYMQTVWVENLGNDQFIMHSLPFETQLAPVYGIIATNIDDDEFTDLLMVGNDFGMETQQGRADAFMGLTLRNNGQGGFEALSLGESHFYVPGDGKALVSLNYQNNELLLVASQNNDSLRVFKNTQKPTMRLISLEANEVSAKIEFADGSTQKREYYRGSSFLSQSSRTLEINGAIKRVTFYSHKGELTREVNF